MKLHCKCASILRASRHVATDRYASDVAHSIINFFVLAYNLIHRDSTKKKKMQILDRKRGRIAYSPQIFESDWEQPYLNFVSGILFSFSQNKIYLTDDYVRLVWNFIGMFHVLLTWIFYLDLLNWTKWFWWSERHQRRWKWCRRHCGRYIDYNFSMRSV